MSDTDDMSVPKALGVFSIAFVIAGVFSLLLFTPLAMLFLVLSGVSGVAAVGAKIIG